jgi:hypothetical protein
MTLLASPIAMPRTAALPLEVLEALELEDGLSPDFLERRRQPRSAYVTEGRLDLDAPALWGGRAHVYARDINPRALRFVTRSILTAHTRGTLHIDGPDGEPHAIDCIIQRVRLLVPGWWDVAATFTQTQPTFGEYNLP